MGSRMELFLSSPSQSRGSGTCSTTEAQQRISQSQLGAKPLHPDIEPAHTQRVAEV